MQIISRYVQNRVLRNDNGALDHVLQFADVAGPRILDQRRNGFGRDGIDSLPHLPAVLLYEVSHEQRNVFGPLTQGRNSHWKYVETIVQIGAELLIDN